MTSGPGDIQRRAFLGAAGIGALGVAARAAAAGGPLNPPAGPIAPSAHTLDEIYNRIPGGAALGAYDGRIPISGPGSLNFPGSYVLINNITSGAFATLNIHASNITLDLNGYTVSNSADGGACINLGEYAAYSTVCNGVLADADYGLNDIGPPNAPYGVRLENLRIINPRYAGIALTRMMGVLVRRCTIIDAGARATVPNAAVSGISFSTSAVRIDECAVYNLANPGTGTLLTRGIYQSNANARGNLISRCHLGNITPVNGIGINALASPTIIRDCTVAGYSTNYSGGTGGGGNAG